MKYQTTVFFKLFVYILFMLHFHTKYELMKEKFHLGKFCIKYYLNKSILHFLFCREEGDALGSVCGLYHLLLHCSWLLFWLAVPIVICVLSTPSYCNVVFFLVFGFVLRSFGLAIDLLHAFLVVWSQQTQRD